MSNYSTERYRTGKRSRNVDLTKVQKRLLTILDREIAQLMRLSYKAKLNKDDSASLTNYLRLVKELRKADEVDVGAMTDAQLEKLVGKA